MRKTKIICTLGPAVDNIDTLEQLMIAGMDCARFNFSHGTHEEHLERINKIKSLRKKLDMPVAILLDTKGPEIRLKNFENGFADVKKDDEFIFSPDSSIIGNHKIAGLSYPSLAKDVNIGTRILVDDGKVAFEVKDIMNGELICTVLNSGRLSNHKSLNVPNVAIEMHYISEQDKSDILFGIEQDFDFIAASFVRTAYDVMQLRALLDVNGGGNIKIISKIENTQGIENLDEILNVSDGIMIARGDLGVEIPFKELPAIQKDVIKRCYRAGKYVVTATQMLESMTKNPRPTRAEVSDVANAIYDGTTIIMLSGESAAGDYPVEAVRTMAEIAESTEASIDYEKRFNNNKLKLDCDVSNTIASTACGAAYQINAKALIVVSRTGKTANIVADYRPVCPIIATVIEEKGCRQLNLAWNVHPIVAEEKNSTDTVFEHGIEKALETGIVSKGDMIVIAGGSAINEMKTDMIKIHKV
ncbi:pyruvate kinase [Holotrichia oblita]|nr:pyruvate kinase [Holotrichia oblita]